ncbi:hypothetical protein ANCDUO_19890 [Ancylostoma duodenale]|uniref:Uncharacterized protein n=1 Tax=Ancylostoma duodenale TaxID=51022 RepID=A0A0C2FTN0_9BILA|nr:hypothetical protein ANCDUO_19890 [Ancylostoma duodenale]
MSMLIPFTGLLLADGSLLLQAIFFEYVSTPSTPYFFPLSELIFGCFGGYMAIISTSFAYITSIPGVTSKERSKSIARLEGALGVGGSSHILFFYLKQRFYWDAEYYGYLRALTQFSSTVMALFVYPLCKSYGVRDASLVLIGLVARGIGRVWLAVAWNGPSVLPGRAGA